MTEPRIAVLIPVYNNQAGLDRSVESLRDAKGDFDLVIVDDGSPVPLRPPPALRRHAAFRLLRLEKNSGITRALNHGLEFILAGHYEYVARLDAGDTVAPERFELQAAYLDAETDCAAVSSFIDFIDDNEDVLFCHRSPTAWKDLQREMRVRNCLLHSGAMLRATALAEAGAYDERYLSAEDYELFLRLSRTHRLAVLPRVLTATRYDVTGISLRGRRRQQWSRLRCQVRYFDASTWHSFFGVARTLAALLAPRTLVMAWKQRRAH